MPVVDVRVVGMAVQQRLVMMLMGMRLFAVPAGLVRVAMVRVVNVRVVVSERFVQMLVFVPLGQMQPDAERHQGCRRRKNRREGLSEKRDRNRGTDEWRGREVGAGARAAEMPQGHDEQHQAQPVAHETEQQDGGDVRRRRQLVAERERQRGVGAAGREALAAAMMRASAPDTLRVRLLSRAHARQAAATQQEPRIGAGEEAPDGHANNAPPATMARKPVITRGLVASRNAIHARSAVNTLSRFNRSELVAASRRRKPVMSSTGATMPPARVAAASQIQSMRRSPSAIAASLGEPDEAHADAASQV